MSFRFRDVYDHLVRIADDALIFQDRITGILDAHLSNVSNRLNEVMKVLTVVATIFMPLTLLTGIYGMNVPLPQFPGGERRSSGGSSASWRSPLWRCSRCSAASAGSDVGKITRLPADLANQIAAGEVVERPASVVKELVENAIDAGARRLTIHVELGGKKQVRVEDDGEGMEPEDARLAIERHATSKIRRADDLAAITTLGFRGEALPSIASVSHFLLRTRAAGQHSGTEIRVNGGAVASVAEVGAAEGTVVEVNDLFYNLPARRKFLKSDGAESAQVSRIVTQLALAYPEVGFTLTSGGRTVLQCPPAASLRDRLYQVYGERDDLIEVGKEAGGLRLTGYIAALAGTGAHARAPERLHQPPHRQGPDDRARDHRRLQRRVDQGAQPGGASVHRDAARRGRRQRPPDESGSPVPRSVARARGRAPRADGRARPGRRAAAAAAPGERFAVAGRHVDSGHAEQRGVSQSLGAARRVRCDDPTEAAGHDARISRRP